MPEYKHEDKKEYIIAEGQWWKIWNNGIVESYSDYDCRWYTINSNYTWEKRIEFVKCWEKAEIGEGYDFSWSQPKICYGMSVKFLGFREQCPECKQLTMIWENKIQLCKGCDYIHAFEYDDS